MSEQPRRTTGDDSRGRRADHPDAAGSAGRRDRPARGRSRGARVPSTSTLELLLLAVAAIGGIALVVSEFLPLWEVKTITAVIDDQTGLGAHRFALGLIGLVTLPLAVIGISGRSRPATLALGALGLIAAVIALGADLPDATSEGNLARNYEAAEASPKLGLYVETAGAALVLVAAVCALVLQGGGDSGRPLRAPRAGGRDAAARERERSSRRERARPPAPESRSASQERAPDPEQPPRESRSAEDFGWEQPPRRPRR